MPENTERVEGKRWTIKRKVNLPQPWTGNYIPEQAVVGPDTDWVEVIPAALLERAAEELEERAEKHRRLAEVEQIAVGAAIFGAVEDAYTDSARFIRALAREDG